MIIAQVFWASSLDYLIGVITGEALAVVVLAATFTMSPAHETSGERAADRQNSNRITRFMVEPP